MKLGIVLLNQLKFGEVVEKATRINRGTWGGEGGGGKERRTCM